MNHPFGYMHANDGIAEPCQPKPTGEPWTAQDEFVNREGTVVRTGLYLKDRKGFAADVTDLEKGLADEADARLQADGALTQEILDLENQVSNLDDWHQPLQLETNARVAGDTSLRNDLDAEINTRQALDTALDQRITSEVSVRSQADASLSQSIMKEITDRQDADTALSDRITQEVTDRDTADKQIVTSLTALQNGYASLGTAAHANTGTAPGDVVIVQPGGMIDTSILPSTGGTSIPLYPTTGPATDGAMTQKASTDEFAKYVTLGTNQHITSTKTFDDVVTFQSKPSTANLQLAQRISLADDNGNFVQTQGIFWMNPRLAGQASNGIGVGMGFGGLTIIGGGESHRALLTALEDPTTTPSALTGVSGGSEHGVLVGDTNVYIGAGYQNGGTTGSWWKFDNTGKLFAPDGTQIQGKLYTTFGVNEDGAITQKAITQTMGKKLGQSGDSGSTPDLNTYSNLGIQFINGLPPADVSNYPPNAPLIGGKLYAQLVTTNATIGEYLQQTWSSPPNANGESEFFIRMSNEDHSVWSDWKDLGLKAGALDAKADQTYVDHEFAKMTGTSFSGKVTFNSGVRYAGDVFEKSFSMHSGWTATGGAHYSIYDRWLTVSILGAHPNATITGTANNYPIVATLPSDIASRLPHDVPFMWSNINGGAETFAGAIKTNGDIQLYLMPDSASTGTSHRYGFYQTILLAPPPAP